MSTAIISNRIIKYLDAAINEAKKSTMQFALGAVVVRNGKIISRGYNFDRTYKNRGSCPSVHAEVSAVSEFMSLSNIRSFPSLFKPRVQCKKRCKLHKSE